MRHRRGWIPSWLPLACERILYIGCLYIVCVCLFSLDASECALGRAYRLSTETLHWQKRKKKYKKKTAPIRSMFWEKKTEIKTKPSKLTFPTYPNEFVCVLLNNDGDSILYDYAKWWRRCLEFSLLGVLRAQEHVFFSYFMLQSELHSAHSEHISEWKWNVKRIKLVLFLTASVEGLIFVYLINNSHEPSYIVLDFLRFCGIVFRFIIMLATLCCWRALVG